MRVHAQCDGSLNKRYRGVGGRGSKQKHITSTLVFATVVEVEPVTTDRYGRTVVFVRVGDTLVNEEMIRQGLACVFTGYCDRPICREWRALEEARNEKLE